jgi:hypothetical protein
MPATRFVERLLSARKNFLIAGVAGLLLSAAGLFLDREHFFHAWLTAWIFWTGIGLGSMGVLLLHNATGGDWGVEIRRILESAARTLPLSAVLFLPLLFGLGELYIWARPEVVASDHLLRHKAPYLNVPFFLIRTALYFAIWIAFTRWFTRLSLEQDRQRSRAISRRLRLVSGPGLVVYMLTMTFASVDWVMSLEPHWFSTIFGALLIIGQVLSAFAFAVIVNVLFMEPRSAPPGNPESPLYDLGNLMLAFVMIWAYLAFSQFLIIWQANLAEEIPWYLRRLTGGWQLVGLLLVLFHFALPFALLIWRGVKRKPKLLLRVAGLILFMRLVDLFWTISPATRTVEALTPHWVQFVTPIGIGGLWLAAFLGGLQQRWEVPAHDLNEAEELEHAPA